MKNPFLQDRNIFSKVQKPTTTKSYSNQKDTMQNQKKIDQKKSYTATQFHEQSNIKPSPYNTATAGLGTTYQRQSSKQTPVQYSLGTNNKFTSQKITFGDPTSSQAYHEQRTSGYFKIKGLQNNERNQKTYEKYNENAYEKYSEKTYEKYEPKINNFTGIEKTNPFTKNSYRTDMKQTKRMERNSPNIKRNQNKIDYEFAPPPINNFQTDYQPNDKIYGYREQNYDYKSGFGNQKSQQIYSMTKNEPNDDRFSKPNPFLNQQKSMTFKSPPKTNPQNYTPKNDISYQFRQNNYAELSPIGEVSHHKIQDSIMNLDGLIENVELDKLLAESKTQEELLKMLGMDASALKKNPVQQQNNKYILTQNTVSYQYDSKTVQQSSYFNQRQNLFTKKAYQNQAPTQKAYQNQIQVQQPYKNENNFRQDEEPQVLSYAQNYTNHRIQTKQKNPNKIMPAQNYDYSQIKQPQKMPDQSIALQNPYESRPNSYYQQKNNDLEEDDLETIIQKQMEKYIQQKQGPLKGKRIFMTPSQKIITKKYNLAPL